MTIFEFLELNAGQWFTHRTSHDVSSGEQSGLKMNLAIELLEASKANVVELCQAYQLDASQIYAAQITWESLPDLKTKKQTGADLLIFVPNPDDEKTGQVYRKAKASSTTSRYSLNHEDRLTLITNAEDLVVEECVWFESPNVRLRHSIILQDGSASLVSFASEIRRMTTPPAAAT